MLICLAIKYALKYIIISSIITTTELNPTCRITTSLPILDSDVTSLSIFDSMIEYLKTERDRSSDKDFDKLINDLFKKMNF